MHTDSKEAPRLKFLFTTTFYPPYHIGGDALHVKWLADELVKEGHQVHVMFSLDAYELKRGKIAGVQLPAGAPDVYPVRAGRGRLEPLSVYVRGRSGCFSEEFERLLGQVSPDVVHHHNEIGRAHV